MRLEIRPHAEVELPGRLRVAAIGADGSVLLRGPRSFALVAPTGSVVLHGSVDEQVVAADLSDAGRVAVLEAGERGGRVHVVEPDGERRAFDADPAGEMLFWTGTGGAILWASEDELWLGGAIGDDDVAVRLVEAGRGGVRAEARVRDPYAESELRLRAGMSRSECFVNLNAGQHGVWAHAVEHDGARLTTHAIAGGEWVTDQYAIDTETLLYLQDYTIVRRSREVEVTRSTREQGFPYAIDRASRGRALVQTDRGAVVLVDESSLEIVAELALAPPNRAYEEVRARGPHIVATSAPSRFDHTRVLLATLPD